MADELTMNEAKTVIVESQGSWNLKSITDGSEILLTTNMTPEQRKKFMNDYGRTKVAIIRKADVNQSYESEFAPNFELSLNDSEFEKVVKGSRRIELIYTTGVLGVPRILNHRIFTE